MHRFYVLLACLMIRSLLLTGIYLLLLAHPLAAADRPNIIFILCDDLGWGDLSINQHASDGQPMLETPQLDQLASEGVLLSHHYCSAPVCASSRSTLLTGVHQGFAVIRDNQFDRALEDNHTLASVLKRTGYATALVGKYGLQGDGDTPQDWEAYPTKRGFDTFFGYVRHRDGHQHYPAHNWPLGDSDAHRTPKELWHDDREISSELTGCYTADLFTAKSKNWIAEQVEVSPEQPFFLYLAYDTPHAALQLPPGPYPAGGGLEGGVQWIGKPDQLINTASDTIDSYVYPEFQRQELSDVAKRFASSVRRLDDCIGDLQQTLVDLGIDDSTVIVFSSDNGPHEESYLQNAKYTPEAFRSYANLQGIKRDCWEGGLRVPTFVWGPGLIDGGRSVDRFSSFHDWLPTLTDAAGQVAPARTTGRSLWPMLTGQVDPEDHDVYTEYEQNGRTPNYDDFDAEKRGQRRGQMQVVTIDGLKAIRYNVVSGDEPFQLFDVRRDPREMNDLSSQPPYREVLERAQQLAILNHQPSPEARRPYDDRQLPSMMPERPHQSIVASYDGVFPYAPHPDSLPEPTRLEARSGPLSDINVQSNGPGYVVLRGVIEVPAAGRYQPRFSSGGRAFIRVHQTPVVDADTASNPQIYAVELEAGSHPILMVLETGNELPAVQFELQRATDG